MSNWWLQVASRLPAIIHGDETLTDPDEIVQYIDTHFHYPPMAYDNLQVCIIAPHILVWTECSRIYKWYCSKLVIDVISFNKNNYCLTTNKIEWVHVLGVSCVNINAALLAFSNCLKNGKFSESVTIFCKRLKSELLFDLPSFTAL